MFYKALFKYTLPPILFLLLITLAGCIPAFDYGYALPPPQQNQNDDTDNIVPMFGILIKPKTPIEKQISKNALQQGSVIAEKNIQQCIDRQYRRIGMCQQYLKRGAMNLYMRRCVGYGGLYSFGYYGYGCGGYGYGFGSYWW